MMIMCNQPKIPFHVHWISEETSHFKLIIIYTSNAAIQCN